MLLKIGLFTFHDNNRKCAVGIPSLVSKLGGSPISIIFAEPGDKREDYDPSNLMLPPQEYAKALHIPYAVIKHNDAATIAAIKELHLDLGIVLGAKLLDKEVIEAFTIGIINAHPGKLPDYGGSSTIQWAIKETDPVYVTCHMIDPKLDTGEMLEEKQINVEMGDTYQQFIDRVLDNEIEMLVRNTIRIDKAPDHINTTPIRDTKIWPKMNVSVEKFILMDFNEYKMCMLNEQ